MKPGPFDYHAPATVDEAVGLLADLGDEAKVLAGGQSLIPMLNVRLARFDALVDLRKIEPLRTIAQANGSVQIGAMVRQHEVEESTDLAITVPLLNRATPLIGHFQIRNQGTVGGSVAHADPASEYPAVALTLDAELEVAGPGGTRTIPASQFFTGTWSTALEEGEILVATRFPVARAGDGFAVEEVARRHGDFAIAGATVAARVAGGDVERVAIGLFGVGSTPVRAEAVEKTFTGVSVAGVDPEEVGQVAAGDLDPPDDIHASGALRRRIAAAVVSRALGRALEEAARG